MLPGLFELLLGVFSFVPVDWLGHGGVFLWLGLFDFSILFVTKLFDNRALFLLFWVLLFNYERFSYAI